LFSRSPGPARNSQKFILHSAGRDVIGITGDVSESGISLK
jgi:hypothetical protein